MGGGGGYMAPDSQKKAKTKGDRLVNICPSSQMDRIEISFQQLFRQRYTVNKSALQKLVVHQGSLLIKKTQSSNSAHCEVVSELYCIIELLSPIFKC